jgi:hypothetical protein
MKKLRKRKVNSRKRGKQTKRRLGRTTKNTRCRNVRQKDIFIDVDVEKSDLEVFVAIYVMKDNEPLKLIKLEIDRNSFSATVEFAKESLFHNSHQLQNAHVKLAKMLSKKYEKVKDLGTVLLNFIGYFINSEETLENYPEQSIGFSLRFDMDNLDDCVLIGKTKSEVESFFNAVIGSPLNDASINSVA